MMSQHEGSGHNEPDAALRELTRQNHYLRERNAQLQGDIVGLQAETHRLRQIVERLHGRSARPAPDPLSGGQ